MKNSRFAIVIAIGAILAIVPCLAASLAPSTDPLAAIDLNRNSIIADIVKSFEAYASDDAPGASTLRARLEKLRADRLLAASLASRRESLEAIIAEANSPRSAAFSQVNAKALGDPNRDLVYTPLTPCRLIDTRGNGAPFQGGAFAPGERRAYVPAGACSIPATDVATMLISFTTQNLTPVSGGVLAILAPAAPFTATVDVFNLGSIWSASSTAVATGSAGQFDVIVLIANAHVIVDVLGYFGPAAIVGTGGGTVTSVSSGLGLTGGPITTTGTIGLAPTQLLPPAACTPNQIPKWNGAAWACAADANSGGTVTGVTASAPLASSGGTAPVISLNGAIPVANGGTGQATLATNGILYGQGTAGVGTAVGLDGQVFAGTAGAPAWTASPSISGNLTLVDSTASTGNILKAGVPFIHNHGTNNTFIGENAGNFNMTGQQVTAGGVNALRNNTTGTFHTAVGYTALYSNTSGPQNTAVGNGALYSNTIGGTNTALGVHALFGNSTGANNIALGYYAGSNLTTGSNNIHIGNDGVVAEGNTVRIGDGSQTKAFISGIRGATTANNNAIPVLVDSAGQLGTVSSSRRFKDAIADMDAASSALMKLHPVTFHYKSDKNPSGRTLHYGLIAEEVAEVYPGLVARSADGLIETVMYQYLPPMLLNEFQKQQRTIHAQAEEMTRQKMRIAELEQDRQAQVARMDALEMQAAKMAVALERLAPVNVAAH